MSLHDLPGRVGPAVGHRTTVEEPDNLALHPRDVRFDWSTVPMHWLPGEPVTTHLFNVLHLLLPEGERWFVRTFTEALPYITDERVREDVIGFIGQEAIHAEAHQEVLAHLLAHGLDPRPFVRRIEYLFRTILTDRPHRSERVRRTMLIERLAVVAAIEHFTAYLGHWVLNSPGLDRAGAHPIMLDLLRWHGAEEVEHRSVAFDVLHHFDRRYLRRVRTTAIVGPILGFVWVQGVRFLIAADPTLDRTVKARWRDLPRAKRLGLAPGYLDLTRASLRFLKPGYHPSREGSTAQAIAYLASSPAALAAAR